MRADPLLTLVERAYEPADGSSEWIEGLIDAAGAVVPEALAVAVRLVELDPPMTVGFAVRSPDDALAAALRAHEESARGRRGDVVLRGNPGLKRLAADSDPSCAIIRGMRRRFLPLGSREMAHVTACDGHGRCATIGFLIGGDDIDGVAPGRWGKLEVHLAASLRLRARRRELLTELVRDGAVLTPDGRVVDADGVAQTRSARERLSEAVRRLDAARGGEAGDPLVVWRGLVDGTWSIVDRHDHDGRRYIVAVPNEIVPDEAVQRYPLALSPREAQVAALAAEGYSDKWIGYTLGLSRSTVSTHLHAALQKLRVTSRVGLAQAFRMTGELEEPGAARARLPAGSEATR